MDQTKQSEEFNSVISMLFVVDSYVALHRLLSLQLVIHCSLHANFQLYRYWPMHIFLFKFT